MTFSDLHLDSKLLQSIEEAGYHTPSEIQAQAIPEILSKHDIFASAQTGTGKTAAFLLPAIQTLTTSSQNPGKGPRVLILVPTRELAMQVDVQAKKYGKYLKHAKSVCIVGGVPYPVQRRKLSGHYDILIATPGRLIDFIEQGKVNFSRLEIVVLDEADRMLDMGFLPPVEQIMSSTPDTRQTLLFSATMQKSVLKFSKKWLKNPREIAVHTEKERHENIEQTLHYVDNVKHKNQLLTHILDQEGVEHSIVFTSTKRHANQLANELRDIGYLASPLHGDMNQRQRSRTIKQYRDGKFKILVATDVAARGIDVQSVTHVINFDLPQNEDYVHRIGRTGRAGATGQAFSFASSRDAHLVKDIEAYIGQKIDVVEVPGLEPKQKQVRTRPKKNRSNADHRKRNRRDQKVWKKSKPKRFYK